jgi:Glycosyl transferases group 1
MIFLGKFAKAGNNVFNRSHLYSQGSSIMNLNHIVLTNPALSGFAYGMLRDFESEILRLTGGEEIVMPKRNLPNFLEHRLAHGTRYASLRKFVPQINYDLKADVLWVILMGPEDFPLDLFKNWDKNIGTKILYIFDTFESQLPAIRRVLQSAKWHVAITSFHSALPFLTAHTQQQWHAIAQGVKLDRFAPVTKSEKLISFSAYGRRLDNVHRSVQNFCLQTGKYYEYTTTTLPQKNLDPRENYHQYAWHLKHSFFTFSWPVELTNPQRVLTFSPITCRWFEAAASGTVILGQAPKDSEFVKIFGNELVIPIEPDQQDYQYLWEKIWQERDDYLQSALRVRDKFAESWSWESRVREILKLINA